MGIVARQSIKGTIATYIGVAVGIVTTFFIQTKAFQPEQIGLIDILLQCSLLFGGLAQLGTNSSAMRYYPFFKDEKHRDHGFFGWTLLVPLIGFTFFLLAFFLFKGTIVNFFTKDSEVGEDLFAKYVNFVVPLAFFMLYISVFETNSNLLLRIVLPKFIREVGLRVGTLTIYLLYFYKIIDFDGVIISFCILYGLATIINIVYLMSLQRVSFKIEPKFISAQLRRGQRDSDAEQVFCGGQDEFPFGGRVHYRHQHCSTHRDALPLVGGHFEAAHLRRDGQTGHQNG